MNDQQQITKVFSLFAKWYNQEFQATGKKPNLKELGKVFTHKFKKWRHKRFGTHQWQICVNGQDTEQLDPIGKCGIQPYHIHLYRDNWLVGICTPFEGESIVHSGMLYGLDQEFIVYMKSLLRKQRESPIELAQGS